MYLNICFFCLFETYLSIFSWYRYIVSDCDSLQTALDNKMFIHDKAEDIAAQAMWAGVAVDAWIKYLLSNRPLWLIYSELFVCLLCVGLDFDCGWFYPNNLESSVRSGQIKESDIDKALFNNYLVLFRLGYFDGNPVYDSLNASSVCSNESLRLAADAARQSIVLLKNNNTRLPLSADKVKKIAVVGPHANATEAMITMGSYAGA